MPYVTGIREEELKNKVAADWFADYDCTRIVGNIDFCVSVPADDPRQIDLFERESHLWAEAKAGTHRDLREAFVQLILTIGKARTFDKVLPPAFLGAFDASRIAFLPYSTILEVFYQNDFNWNVTPSDHETKEFRQLAEQVDQTLQSETLTFRYAEDAEELRSFIHRNFVIGKRGISRIHVTKSNFVSIYLKWLDVVKPTIDVDWGVAKRNGILDADFYLADILSNNNLTLKEKLLKKQEYLAAALGENWQDEYVVWDCCAGTGNLLTGLTNKYAIWASTLDQADVDVMRDRIRNGANLLDTHVFRFDFLNDAFDTLPEGLRTIIRDPERRKKLVLYINPPNVGSLFLPIRSTMSKGSSRSDSWFGKPRGKNTESVRFRWMYTNRMENRLERGALRPFNFPTSSSTGFAPTMTRTATRLVSCASSARMSRMTTASLSRTRHRPTTSRSAIPCESLGKTFLLRACTSLSGMWLSTHGRMTETSIRFQTKT